MALPVQSQRYSLFDIVRGVFILLMIASHTIYFTYAGNNQVVRGLSGFADLICFTGLLLISGTVTYLSYVHESHPTHQVTQRVFKRLLAYFVGYYLLALLYLIITKDFSVGTAVSVFLFLKLIPFTEFIPTFIIFSLSALIFRPLYRSITKSITIVLFAGGLSFAAATMLTLIHQSFISSAHLSLLAGLPGWFAFPLLRYFPVYLIGLFLGRRLLASRAPGTLIKQYQSIILVTFAVSLGAIITALVGLNPLDTVIHRWPPTPYFITVSLGFAILMHRLVIYLLKHFSIKRHFKWLLIIGQNAYAVYFSHTLIMFGYKALGFPQVYSILIQTILFVATTNLALWLAKIIPLNYRYGLSLYTIFEDAQVTYQERRTLARLTQKLISLLTHPTQLFTFRLGRRNIKLLKSTNIITASIILMLAAGQLGLAEEYILLSDTIPKLTGSVNQTWFLTNSNESIIYSITFPDTAQNNWIAGPLEAIVDGNDAYPLIEIGNSWQTTFPVNTYQPGTHSIQTRLILGNQILTTKPIIFNVSEPLYVTWTIDWEGYDVPDAYLQALADTSAQHFIPMTHMFNPRIYTAPDITPQRAIYLTDWVKTRHLQGEEIGLHLHMFPDFIEAAGVAPITDQVWGGGFTEGYDMLTTAYSQADLTKIFNHAKTLMQQNSLPEPLSFRAGAWFANNDTLKALEITGFNIDTSGRTAYTFGTNHVPGFWQLETTTQPYFPSKKNQNSPFPPPQLTILEIPNNGADDYAFTATQMIDRFNQNFDSTPLLQPKVVTYLSHPQWYNAQRKTKMETVFTHTDTYVATNGAGPVVYTTLEKLYPIFDHE